MDINREQQREAARRINENIKKPEPKSEWRHKRTGNIYVVDGVSQGSGSLHGHVVVRYRSKRELAEFSRLLIEWHEKMTEVPKTPDQEMPGSMKRFLRCD